MKQRYQKLCSATLKNIKVHDEHVVWGSNLPRNHNHKFTQLISLTTVEPRFNEVAGDRSNLFVKWRVRYIENLDIKNLRGKDHNVRYIEVIVND